MILIVACPKKSPWRPLVKKNCRVTWIFRISPCLVYPFLQNNCIFKLLWTLAVGVVYYIHMFMYAYCPWVTDLLSKTENVTDLEFGMYLRQGHINQRFFLRIDSICRLFKNFVIYIFKNHIKIVFLGSSLQSGAGINFPNSPLSFSVFRT